MECLPYLPRNWKVYLCIQNVFGLNLLIENDYLHVTIFDDYLMTKSHQTGQTHKQTNTRYLAAEQTTCQVFGPGQSVASVIGHDSRHIEGLP